MAFLACPPGLQMPEEVYCSSMESIYEPQGVYLQAVHMHSMAGRLTATHRELQKCLQSHVDTAQKMKDELMQFRSILPQRAPCPTDGEAAHQCWEDISSKPIVWLPLPSLAKSGAEGDALTEVKECAEEGAASCHGESTCSDSGMSEPSSTDSSFSCSTASGETLGSEINLARILDGSEKRTWCLIRNLPGRLTEEGFLQAICMLTGGRLNEESVLRIKLPMCRNRKGIGFAFVEFRRPADVAVFAMAFQGYCWPTMYSYKVSEVFFANSQGLPTDMPARKQRAATW